MAADEEELLKLVHDARLECGDRMDYAIIQPKMINRKEYKVVVLGGSAKYVSNCSTIVDTILFVICIRLVMRYNR